MVENSGTAPESCYSIYHKFHSYFTSFGCTRSIQTSYPCNKSHKAGHYLKLVYIN
nr:MAG TPA: hypothetical protein [Caudoviricetes sp.]